MANEEQDRLEQNRRALEMSRAISHPGMADRLAKEEAQQGFLDNVSDGFKGTALYRMGKWAYDEVPDTLAALSGYPSATPNWDETLGYKEKSTYDKHGPGGQSLIADLPVQYWDDVLAHDSLDKAMRTKSRIVSNLARKSRLMQQEGATSTIAMIAGGFLDVDLPLAVLSGGAIGGAKIMRGTYQASRAAGLSATSATTFASVVGNAAGVAQAAAIVTMGAKAVDPTMGWDDVTLSILTGAAVGGGLGAFLRGDAKRAVDRMRTNLTETKITRPAESIDQDVDFRANEGAMEFTPFIDEVTDIAPGPSGPSSQSLGAARVSTQPTGPIVTPYGNVSGVDAAIIRNSSDWLDRTGARQHLVGEETSLWGGIVSGAWADQAANGVVGKVIKAGKKTVTRAVQITGHDVMRLAKSKTNTANWAFLNIFENPAGYAKGQVPATASTLKAVYEARIASTMVDYPSAMNSWAKRNPDGLGFPATISIGGRQTGVGISDNAREVFNKKIYQNLNDIRAGRSPRHTDPDVVRGMAMVQNHGRASLDVLKGDTSGRFAVKGMEKIDYEDGYIPQQVSGSKVVRDVADGTVRKDDVIDAFSLGYQRLGMPKDSADVVASAVFNRAANKELDVDTNLLDMLNEDGREFLRQRLQAQGHSAQEIDNIMTKLTGIAEERGRAGFTKHRNDLDLDISVPTTNGQRRSLLDYMETDITDVLHRHRRGVSGAGALARKGLRSAKDVDVFYNAMRQEASSIGEEMMPSDMFHAMMSEFRSGPMYGYMNGKITKGIDPATSVAMGAANLSLLHSLGFAQLAEEGNLLATAGFRSWLDTSRAMIGLDKDLRDVNNQLLDDLIPFVGEIGKDHIMFRPHRNLDDVDRGAEAEWFKGVRRGVENLSYINSYTSLFNHVRSRQQRKGAILLSNKVFSFIKAGQHTQRIKEDLGISDEMFDKLKDLVDTGVIQFRTIRGKEYVNRLNPKQWADKALIDDFASVMMRQQSRIVQKALAGERDVWMGTNAGALLSHLKSFPLTALPKQFMRNAKFMDTEAMATVMYGMASAYVALTLRDVMLGNDRSQEERLRATITYSNMTGWIPMGVDPLMTMIGLDDYRISKYGRHYETTLPVLDVANRVMRVPGAVGKMIVGEQTNADRSAILALPFMRTLGIGEWLLPDAAPKRRPSPPAAPAPSPDRKTEFWELAAEARANRMTLPDPGPYGVSIQEFGEWLKNY